MKTRRWRRPGVMLALVMMVMAMISYLLAVLATCSVGHHRERQLQRVRCAARSLTDSSLAYARSHLEAWQTAPPEQTINLDVTALLPERMKGSAQISFIAAGDSHVCHITVRVERFGLIAADQVDLAFDRL